MRDHSIAAWSYLTEMPGSACASASEICPESGPSEIGPTSSRRRTDSEDRIATPVAAGQQPFG